LYWQNIVLSDTEFVLLNFFGLTCYKNKTKYGVLCQNKAISVSKKREDIPLDAWTGPQAFSKLRLPEFQ